MSSAARRDLADASPAGGLAVAPSLAPALRQEHLHTRNLPVDRRVLWICALAVFLGVLGAGVAWILVHLIGFVTHVAFEGRISFTPEAVPATSRWGAWIIVVPAIGGLIVGLMARFGSRAIRGHGIPEAMEQILLNQSRIPARMTWLKPVSSAIAIGTGGPFGAEGPIIATGGALGSLLGQTLHINAAERKTLLAAGAAAGMSAIFGAPVSATLLAIELLLFEFKPRSLIPVACAAVTAAAIRAGHEGMEPVFAMPDLVQPGGIAMACYVLIGAAMGVLSMVVTRAVYFVEDAFEHLPVHWMWWPAIGGLVVGVIGWINPRTLGVGYSNISDVLSDRLGVAAVLSLCLWKFISWSIALGSGTSGGTLAPMFTIGGSLGALIGVLINHLTPGAHLDVRIAALVGMAAIFAGASRALLASAVFAFETTLQPLGLMPLLGGCAVSYLVSALLMRNSIMTEKIARRGVRVPEEYHADELDRVRVLEVASKPVISLRAEQTIATTRTWMDSLTADASHQGYPVVDGEGALLGVVTRRDLLGSAHAPDVQIAQILRRTPIVAFADQSLREAIDLLALHDIGRLPVVGRDAPRRVIAMLTRGDVLRAYGERKRHAMLPTRRWRASPAAGPG